MNRAKLVYKRAALEEVQSFKEFIIHLRAKLGASLVTEQEAPGFDKFCDQVTEFDQTLRTQIMRLKNEVTNLERKPKND